EQDDVHNGSVFHPAAVVFPAVLAVAQSERASGQDVITAAVAGYEVGIRVGEFLGRSHYKFFHTTGTAGTVAAAAAGGRLLRLDADRTAHALRSAGGAVGRLLGLDADRMAHAFGSAGTQAAGLWEFLREAADSKQLHTAHAASAGLRAACLAADACTGAKRMFAGRQGMAPGLSRDAYPARLADRLGTRWALPET